MRRLIADENLLRLLRLLEAEDYRFTAVTPATHARFLDRNGDAPARNLRDIFGWNLPFAPETLPPAILETLRDADALDQSGALLKSRLRAASAGGRLFLHSAFPTDSADAVFFGPDTYRFKRLIAAEAPALAHTRRIVDIGAGTGAGGIFAARLLPNARLTLTDINASALALAAVNARHAGIDAELVEGSALDAVEGEIDLIVANPPYIMDADARSYRDGGGLHGAALSLEWALAGARRLSPGGTMILYTGIAIVQGRDEFRKKLEEQLPALGATLRYEELDPDIFGEELEEPAYRDVERIAAVGAIIRRS